MKTFDEKLTEEQRRKAAILRKSVNNQYDFELKEVNPKARTKDNLETFDDGLTSYVQRSKALELRKRCKAELYWDKANDEEKTAIKEAIAQGEPYVKNKLALNHFMGRSFDSLIKDETVLNYIIRNVLGLV